MSQAIICQSHSDQMRERERERERERGQNQISEKII